jgi:ATP-dependent Clp protease ATP-binding subunit ClpC
LTTTEAALDLLAVEGFDPELGARPLRRAFQRLVEDPLSEAVLLGTYGAGDTVVVDAEVDIETARTVIVIRQGELLGHPVGELSD